jgi:pimeloyl-ACP methyl ester carboxylesterase
VPGVWLRAESRCPGSAAQTKRVCAYDRAGLGWSEPGPEPRDAKQVSGELHTLLTNAGIEGPYMLVGHSYGGCTRGCMPPGIRTRWQAWP